MRRCALLSAWTSEEPGAGRFNPCRQYPTHAGMGSLESLT